MSINRWFWSLLSDFYFLWYLCFSTQLAESGVSRRSSWRDGTMEWRASFFIHPGPWCDALRQFYHIQKVRAVLNNTCGWAHNQISWSPSFCIFCLLVLLLYSPRLLEPYPSNLTESLQVKRKNAGCYTVMYGRNVNSGTTLIVGRIMKFVSLKLFGT